MLPTSPYDTRALPPNNTTTNTCWCCTRPRVHRCYHQTRKATLDHCLYHVHRGCSLFQVLYQQGKPKH